MKRIGGNDDVDGSSMGEKNGVTRTDDEDGVSFPSFCVLYSNNLYGVAEPLRYVQYRKGRELRRKNNKTTTVDRTRSFPSFSSSHSDQIAALRETVAGAGASFR